MALIIKNLQQTVKLNISQLHLDITLIRRLAGYQNFGFGVMLTSTEEIHQLNKNYRDEDCATDVLAFPYYDEVSTFSSQCYLKIKEYTPECLTSTRMLIYFGQNCRVVLFIMNVDCHAAMRCDF